MCQLEVTEESQSPWSSLRIMDPKPDRSLQFCNDIQRLNKVAKFDSYPLLQMDGLMQCMGEARYISTRDLTEGYWKGHKKKCL